MEIRRIAVPMKATVWSLARCRRFSSARVVFAVALTLSLGAPLEATVITVNSADGGPADQVAECTLHSALLAANHDSADFGCPAGNGLDIIEFAPAVSYILLEEALPLITEVVHIVGPGRESLTIDGDDLFRPFFFVSTADGSLVADLEIARGAASDFGGCLFGHADDLTIQGVGFDSCTAMGGGAIATTGDRMILERSYLHQNQADEISGAVLLSGTGHLIDRSTFHGNRAGIRGGAIQTGADVELTITRSTFFGNESEGSGGALYVGGVNLSVTSSTFAKNVADSDESGSGVGGGIAHEAGVLALENALIAENFRGAGVRSDIELLTSRGSLPAPDFQPGARLFVSDNTGAESELPEGTPNAFGSMIGASGAPLDSQLSAIGAYGGPTPTVLSASSSFVIDKGTCPGEVADQRGLGNPASGLRVVDRPPFDIDDGCDIGAVEMGAEELFVDGFESGGLDAWSP